ncbi:MAG: zinc ribbon domain-containing protein [Clostridia bacterium]|nr:zinc ribbon domain-containing protein [Clostridia bacterium]
MKMIDLTCPNCGASLNIGEGMEKVFCMHCGHQLLIDGGKIRADSGSFRQAGYEFERGRMQARAEGMQPALPVTVPKDNPRERHLNRVHRLLLFLASTIVFFLGLTVMEKWLTITLCAAILITAVADRRINFLVRILVIPAMLLILLTSALR